MNLFYPHLTLRQFGWILLFGFGGALIAGIYGIVHDQITFRIAPEYFTEFKFQQFYYLPQTQPQWLIVMEIGFLATWWVGFIAGWLMGRLTIPHLPLKAALKQCLKGVTVMMITAVGFALAAYAWAWKSPKGALRETWVGSLAERGVIDLVAFAQVASIHNATYLGGLVGLILALMWMQWRRPFFGG